MEISQLLQIKVGLAKWVVRHWKGCLNKLMPSFRQIMRRVFSSGRDSLKVTDNITGIGCGEKDVATAGTAETLVASSTAFKEVDIQAKETNTGDVAVGDSTVDAAADKGIHLTPGASIRLQGDDLQDIYLDVETNGDGVRFTYYT